MAAAVVCEVGEASFRFMLVFIVKNMILEGIRPILVLKKIAATDVLFNYFFLNSRVRVD